MAYFDYAQLYQRLRPKRSYAVGFTTTPLGFALLFLGCALSVAMPQALQLRPSTSSGQAQAELRTSSVQVAGHKSLSTSAQYPILQTTLSTSAQCPMPNLARHRSY
ncbi:MAG: hypothetical protein V7L20_19025 [Nostoc sp.]